MSEHVHITGLRTYPIKSCAPIMCDRVELGPRGLELDRRWMLVTPEGEFINQLDRPRMALITPSRRDDALEVCAPGCASPLSLALEVEGAPARFEVYGDAVEGVFVGAEADAWFSQALGRACRLVRLFEQTERAIRASYIDPHEDAELIDGRVGFADDFPVLVTSESSLARLEGEAGASFEMARFRPNVIIDGLAPFAEQTWRALRAPSGARLVAGKPCVRCAITTIEPSTGVKQGPEPLKTLARINRNEKGAVFGALMAPGPMGELRVGDALRVD